MSSVEVSDCRSLDSYEATRNSYTLAGKSKRRTVGRDYELLRGEASILALRDSIAMQRNARCTAASAVARAIRPKVAIGQQWDGDHHERRRDLIAAHPGLRGTRSATKTCKRVLCPCPNAYRIDHWDTPERIPNRLGSSSVLPTTDQRAATWHHHFRRLARIHTEFCAVSLMVRDPRHCTDNINRYSALSSAV